MGNYEITVVLEDTFYIHIEESYMFICIVYICSLIFYKTSWSPQLHVHVCLHDAFFLKMFYIAGGLLRLAVPLLLLFFR